MNLRLSTLAIEMGHFKRQDGRTREPPIDSIWIKIVDVDKAPKCGMATDGKTLGGTCAPNSTAVDLLLSSWLCLQHPQESTVTV
jgi:hypothetical protein